jgi:hypothetical protein
MESREPLGRRVAEDGREQGLENAWHDRGGPKLRELRGSQQRLWRPHDGGTRYDRDGYGQGRREARVEGL